MSFSQRNAVVLPGTGCNADCELYSGPHGEFAARIAPAVDQILMRSNTAHSYTACGRVALHVTQPCSRLACVALYRVAPETVS